jgi:hypothetical protein
MKRPRFTLAAAILVFATGVSVARTASAQPHPPMPPGMGEAWAWSDGRWAEPPRKHAHWVQSSYKRVKGGTRYTPRHWSYEEVIYN